VLGEMGICLLLDTDTGPLVRPGGAPQAGGEARVR
jgi:hypothetical protein